jgi:serine phosphatase RsbU (regulator of sigma subunit)
MKKILTSLLFFSITIHLSAGAGFFNTLFGDGDHEFICYSRVHRNYYLIIFFIVMGLGLLAWSRYRIKKKSAEELLMQKNIIAEQNKDILDSIRYASRMQEALKPEKNTIAKILPESFFFLKPRDIVSGDFYFVEESNGKIVIAAIDCTGHGVPGAFLTFIGHNALRHAIEINGSGNPSQLLEIMNREVKQTLGQQRAQNELNDGMEVGLCVYDPATSILNFAGAGMPLLIFKNKMMEEIKGLKCTVGSIQEHITEAPPTHTIQLAKGDSFYIGSDGIPDQFGGKDGKKFRRENLRKYLTEIQSQNMSEQFSKLETILREWMEGHEQTDDMMLIGVRVN